MERRSASEGRAVRAMPFGQGREGSLPLIGCFSARLARQLTGYVVLAQCSCGALLNFPAPRAVTTTAAAAPFLLHAVGCQPNSDSTHPPTSHLPGVSNLHLHKLAGGRQCQALNESVSCHPSSPPLLPATRGHAYSRPTCFAGSLWHGIPSGPFSISLALCVAPGTLLQLYQHYQTTRPHRSPCSYVSLCWEISD